MEYQIYFCGPRAFFLRIRILDPQFEKTPIPDRKSMNQKPLLSSLLVQISLFKNIILKQTVTERQ